MDNGIVSNIIKGSLGNIREKLLKEGKSSDDIQNAINQLKQDKLIVEAIDIISDETVSYMEQSMFENVLEYRADTAEFLARQEQKWGKCFVASEAMYIMTLEASEQYSKDVAELKQEDLDGKEYIFSAISQIHGRALQQYLEILFLMRNGFADGAYARWRSLYELSVISNFICMKGNPVAKAYIEACESDDRYDWAKASECFHHKGERHITFNDIQKQCIFNTLEWKKQYDLANKVVHASPQGTFKRLGNANTNNETPYLSVGHSDYGITISAEHSAISLAAITVDLFGIFPTEDSAVAMQYIYKWVEVIRKYYFSTEKEVFSDPDFLQINNEKV